MQVPEIHDATTPSLPHPLHPKWTNGSAQVKGWSVFYRKVHLPCGPPGPGALCKHGWQHVPSPAPYSPASFPRSPPWPSNVPGERSPGATAGPCTARSELNQCITLQSVGANVIKAQPGKHTALSHQSITHSHWTASFHVA